MNVRCDWKMELQIQQAFGLLIRIYHAVPNHLDLTTVSYLNALNIWVYEIDLQLFITFIFRNDNYFVLNFLCRVEFKKNDY